VVDNCPLEPGVEANHGCKAKQVVIIQKEIIEIADSVHFKLNRAVIEKKSYKLLDNVAQVILAHAEIRKVRIEGHTDNQGKPNDNLKLSQRRAEAVLEYLAQKGVDRNRLVPIGYGQNKPIADNKSKAGRAKNRRVMFVIVDSGKLKIETRDSAPTEETMEP
jgi:outer membrane protein OmpA-like peptidoglycan-associated protein